MELHNRLKQIRKTLDLTQKEMADKLGLANSTYQHYERGENEIPAHVLEKITEFGFNPDWLITGKGEMLTERIESAREDRKNEVDTPTSKMLPYYIERDETDMEDYGVECLKLLINMMESRDERVLKMAFGLLKTVTENSAHQDMEKKRAA